MYEHYYHVLYLWGKIKMTLSTSLFINARIYDYFKGVLYYYAILNNKSLYGIFWFQQVKCKF